ncbi:MAG TPA: RHS repeat-associated core domain-containing protein [Ktedonobacterales bacterium]|nr:RHS repeat-associated core domain-containing protein [Ktedonobacterales bacterium]
MQAPELGSFGVGNIAGLPACAQAVDLHRLRLHVLALDADHHSSKEEVALARRLQEQGYRVALARWDGARGNDLRARYYDPGTGSFLSRDPAGIVPGAVADFNRNSYARNSPIDFTDPSGKGSGSMRSGRRSPPMWGRLWGSALLRNSR